MSDPYTYYAKYDEENFRIKKANRDRKIDKRAQANEDFMKLNGQGMKSVILPLLAKKAKESGKGGPR
jgi:hypothetical protein